jgi:hypothetical protein
MAQFAIVMSLYRCGTCDHAYSRLAALVDGFSFIVVLYNARIILLAFTIRLLNFTIPQIKNKPCHELQ